MLKVARGLSIWLPPLALMGLIFVLSAMPSDDVDRGVAYFLGRKVAHFTEYALLSALWWRALRTSVSARSAVVAAVVIAVAYAATDELHQTTVESRHGTPVDVLIDSAGALTAAGLIVRRRSRLPA